MGSITLKEVLREFDKTDEKGNPIPFNISVFTLNKNSKKGGSLRVYNNARKLVAKKQAPSDSLLTLMASSPKKKKRNPNHFKNSTRNIECQDGKIRTIHIRYIDTFNGKKMVY
jgi:hypothetical protein